MKLKINKACDLNSISVLPPHARRSSGVGASALGRSQGMQTQQQQLRSQQSQQSFSQGLSTSQLGMFSPFSQSSLDETLTNNDQRIGSQERELSAKRTSSLPPINLTREDNQMQLARPSTSLVRKWSVPEYKCQISEELEHRIGMLETSLSRISMILDSIQSDVMQVNKGSKELVLEIESIRQKLIFHDDSLHLMNKGQENLKTFLDEGFKSMSNQIKNGMHQWNIQEINSTLSALPRKFETYVDNIQNDLRNTLTKEIKTMACSLKVSSNKPVIPPSKPPAVTYCSASLDRKSVPVHSKVQQSHLIPKNENGGWKSVKREQVSIKDKKLNVRPNTRRASPILQEMDTRMIIESDDDTDGGFSCLLNEEKKGACLGSKTDVGYYSSQIAKEETERILKKARRRKRKYSNPIIIS